MFPKHQYIRSEKLMRAYRAIPCQHCGKSDGTVCGAHSNWSLHGKGGRIKADDNRCASLCSICHAAIDQGGKFSGWLKKAIWWAAHVKTVKRLVAMDLWPADVPVPDVDYYPFPLEAA